MSVTIQPQCLEMIVPLTNSARSDEQEVEMQIHVPCSSQNNVHDFCRSDQLLPFASCTRQLTAGIPQVLTFRLSVFALHSVLCSDRMPCTLHGQSCCPSISRIRYYFTFTTWIHHMPFCHRHWLLLANYSDCNGHYRWHIMFFVCK